MQRVGYRVSFYDMALSQGLCGWVRNRRDGSVEACVDGDAAALEAIIAWTNKGPTVTQVSHVSIEDAAELTAGTFIILATQ